LTQELILISVLKIPASTCHSTSADPLGGDDGNQHNCGNTIHVPTWLTDGTWTMQWIWFGGIYFLGEYRSCVDYQVSGGPTGTMPTPTFSGGDVSYPNENVCKFANVNTAHACSEPCSGPYPSGIPQKGTPNAVWVGNPNPPAGATASGTATSASGVSGAVSGSNSGLASGSSNTSAIIACNSDMQCPSGVCKTDGYCYVSATKKLDGGGVAAIVFALIFVAVVAFVVIFVVVNKSEWSNWKPFNKKSGGGGGFSS